MRSRRSQYSPARHSRRQSRAAIFPRQHAELIDVPIADLHLDPRRHSLIAGSLSSLLLVEAQALELKLDRRVQIGIVIHDPSP
jgi:hypothetical protein